MCKIVKQLLSPTFLGANKITLIPLFCVKCRKSMAVKKLADNQEQGNIMNGKIPSIFFPKKLDDDVVLSM